MFRSSFVARLMLMLLLVGGISLAVNSAYRSGFALGYMTSEALDAGAQSGAAASVAAQHGPGAMGPWGMHPRGFPFGLLFFGLLVFLVLGRMMHRGRRSGWAHGHPGPWASGPGRGRSCGRPWSGEAEAPREKQPEDIL
jgi:hypothetical protein